MTVDVGLHKSHSIHCSNKSCKLYVASCNTLFRNVGPITFLIICDISQIWQFAFVLNACNQSFQGFVHSTAQVLCSFARQYCV